MLFAAGFGTRMGALTARRPKPLIPLAGRSLIERAIDIGTEAGCAPIVANTHYLADMLEPVLTARGVQISREDGEILDTGGGLKRALPLLGEGPVATLNPDAAWSGPNPLGHLLATGLPEAAEALLLLVPAGRAIGRTGARGDFALGASGRLSRGGDLVYTGAQLLLTPRVKAHPDKVFSLNAIWDGMARAGGLYGIVYPGRWGDVGHPEGLAAAEAMLAESPDV